MSMQKYTLLNGMYNLICLNKPEQCLIEIVFLLNYSKFVLFLVKIELKAGVNVVGLQNCKINVNSKLKCKGNKCDIISIRFSPDCKHR